MKKTLLFLFLSAAISGVSVAQVAITSVPFLQIEPDSRSAGMGNAGVAIADNASAMFWNPAGLAFQTGNQLSITHTNWLPNFNADLFYDYVAGKMYVDGIGTIAGHITYFDLGEQERTDDQGNSLGNFRSYEIATGLSYGFKLNENFAIGTGARFIYSKLVPKGLDVGGQTAQNGTSVGVDISALYRSNEFMLLNRKSKINAGVNLSNIGPAIQYSDNDQKDALPTVLRAGWAYTVQLDEEGYNSLTIANDFSKIMARKDTNGVSMGVFESLVKSWDTIEREVSPNQFEQVPLSEQIMMGIGAEYWYDQKFALRSGYYYEAPNNGDRQFLTFGAGLRYNIFGVDFSYIYTLRENHPLANTIRFSVLLNFK
jgi:long-subunit fatty acid transport protein